LEEQRDAGRHDTALEVANVSVRFDGVVALDDVSLRVGDGEIVGVIGPNGAGKTTLFNAICRLVTPSSGHITYYGQSLLSVSTPELSRMGVARTLQGLGLWPSLTILENVVAGSVERDKLYAGVFALPAADAHRGARERAAMEILEDLGIAHRADAHPVGLPHGDQKRAVIARALMAQPRLLLLDEPASGVSGEEVAQLIDLLHRLRQRMSIALVEHHVDMVMAVSDRVTVLNLGRVIASGSPAEIRANPEVSAAYLGRAVSHA
jgi:branched-chain amino acid transport system ATP-binding protein